MRFKRSVLGSQALVTAGRAVARCRARRRYSERNSASQPPAAMTPLRQTAIAGIGVMTEILAKAMFEIVSSSRKGKLPAERSIVA